MSVASRWSLQQAETGQPIRMLETNNDITERKQAEEAVRKAQAELAHVARVTTLGEMAASIAHEVDQPLSGVVINANACLRFLSAAPPNLDEVRDGLQAIARDGRRASDVIARIRALARRTTTEKEPLDINEVIREVVALAEGEVRRTRARLRTELAGGSPACARRSGAAAAGGAESAPERAGGHARRRATGRASWSSARSASRTIASASRCRTRDPASTRSFGPACSTRSTPPSPMGWGWASRSAVRSSSSTADGSGPSPNDGAGTTFHFTVVRDAHAGNRRPSCSSSMTMRRCERRCSASFGRQGCRVEAFASAEEFLKRARTATHRAAWCWMCGCPI